MRYTGRLFRPPSEAYSLIVQSTIGCSHNKCAFCSMYKEKDFYLRPLEEVLEDFDLARQRMRRVEKVFIADGDALVRKTADWVVILERIRALFPECQRVTSYASPKSIDTKTPEDLRLLHGLGLDMVYLGLESGSDRVLERMTKGESAAQIIACGQKVRQAGIRLSVTAISGLGGQELWQEHAVETGKALSAINPEYIGLLTLMLEGDIPLVDWVREGSFQLLTPIQVMAESYLLLQNLDSPGSVFRANHPSNYLTLRGTLNGDKPVLLAQLEEAMEGDADFRPELFRAL